MNTKNHFFVTFYILLSMHLSCNIACLQAQNPMQDVIYLNDGSILRGRITERHTDSLLKVQIDGGSIFALNPSDIDSIKEEKRFQNSRNTLPGYYNQTGFTIVTGGDQSYPYYRDPLYVSFYSVHGYRFSDRIMTGGGAAMDLNSYLLLQFFADLRWEALKQSASPFAYVQGGYGLPLRPAGFNYVKETKGGLMWSAGAGMRFFFRRQGSFLLSMGYKKTEINEIVLYPLASEQKFHYIFNRLCLNFGLGF
jgi:hypothetical protein